MSDCRAALCRPLLCSHMRDPLQSHARPSAGPLRVGPYAPTFLIPYAFLNPHDLTM